MRKFLVFGVFLALLATVASAGMNDGYTRATGGDVWVNGMHVTGVGSGSPIVKFSNWKSGAGYLTIFGEFECYDDYYEIGTANGYYCYPDPDGTGKRMSLTLSWKNGVQPYGWYWVEGSDPTPVVMDYSFGYNIDGYVDVWGSSTSGVYFSVYDMDVVTPNFWLPLSKV
ncbi:MAG: hypothetical protein QXR60_02590 [Candidatus Nanoarchaeia archaeon]